MRKIDRLRRRRECSQCHRRRSVDTFPDFDFMRSDEEGYETPARLVCGECQTRAPVSPCDACGKASRRAAREGQCSECAEASRPRPRECPACRSVRYSTSFIPESDLCKQCRPFQCRDCGRACDPLVDKVPVGNGYVMGYCMPCFGKRTAPYTKTNPHALLVRRNQSGRSRAQRLGLPVEPVSVDDLASLFASQGGDCPGCHASLPTSLDHIVPLAKGGGHVLANLQFLCPGCNALKSDGTMEDLDERRTAYLDYFGSLL